MLLLLLLLLLLAPSSPSSRSRSGAWPAVPEAFFLDNFYRLIFSSFNPFKSTPAVVLLRKRQMRLGPSPNCRRRRRRRRRKGRRPLRPLSLILLLLLLLFRLLLFRLFPFSCSFLRAVRYRPPTHLSGQPFESIDWFVCLFFLTFFFFSESYRATPLSGVAKLGRNKKETKKKKKKKGKPKSHRWPPR